MAWRIERWSGVLRFNDVSTRVRKGRSKYRGGAPPSKAMLAAAKNRRNKKMKITLADHA